ncbi:MAG: hypothetical protein ACE3L7_29595 [Candidatus Pristimantibacillus sp.]
MTTKLEELKEMKEDKVLSSMRGFITPMDDTEEEEEQPYEMEDVDDCGIILDNFIDQLVGTNSKDEIMASVKSVVEQLNDLNDRCDYALIETEQREDLCHFINKAVNLAGCQTDEDMTLEWREW